MMYLGWVKDRFDDRDYLHRVGVAVISKSVILTEFLPEVRNQGSNNACVGFGIGANLCSVAKKMGIFSEWYSPLWIWAGARYIEGTLSQNVGVSPKDALDWLVKSGCLLEHYWPYDQDIFDMSAPSSERMALASVYDDFSYFRVTGGVTGICSALAEKHLVSLGAPWFNKWFTAPAGVLAIPSKDDFSGGGHETCLYGYDQDKAVFYGINSYGKDWGDLGLFTMPFESLDVFKALGGYDAQYITFNPPVSGPSPQPAPAPSSCKWGTGLASALNVIQEVRGRRGRFYYQNPTVKDN